ILAIGALAEASTDKAITALCERRPALAEEVLAGDRKIDEREVELEEECLKVLALHQPFAQDLRFIVSVLKVNNDLERVGDLAQNIAERAAFLCTQDPVGVGCDIGGMADQVRTMLRRALDALVTGDTEIAREVLVMDEVVDDCHRRMFDDLVPIMRDDPDKIERSINLLSASRNLERIADLATNIAEDVVFMVDGDVIRHRHGA
ncbi:MAG: phosphate signaling complex protein PhoU, partial [Planctomycetota bacterium]